MHIPDSVLSPVTSALAGVAMLPVWVIAARRVRKTLGTRQVPLLALGAAFCFTIMMFNIPALGGTTAHPVAGTLLAILLGPWAAVIGISVALLIQALFFGDGGLVAYGANSFTMAYVLPFVGYSVYRLLASRQPYGSLLRPLCAAVGAFVGLNAAAAMVAVLLGIQPALFHEPNGHALFFPFGLKITLPAMLGTHLVIAGPAEAVVTALVVRYLQAARIPLHGIASPNAAETEQARSAAVPPRGQRREALWIGLLALAALSPLGLLAKGEAWGEWDAQGVAEQTEKTLGAGKGYTPKALALAEVHSYKGIHGLEDYASDDGKNRIGYVGAGILGIGTISALLLLAGRLLARRDQDLPHPRPRSVSERGATSPPTPLRSGAIARSASIAEGGEGSRLDTSLPLQESQTPSSSLSLQERAGVRLHEAEPEEAGSVPPPSMLPDWLTRPSEETKPEDRQERPSNPFIERTLAELTTKAAAALNGERWTRQTGFLQGLDPRAKVIALVGLLVVVACIRQPVTLAALYGLALLLARASRLPLGLMLRRVWLAVPLFVGALALPAVLNTVTPGRELLVLWKQPHLAVTMPGVFAALLLTFRVGVAVSFATLLTLTTEWNDLLRALRTLFLPRLFISVLAMTYRYLLVLLQAAGEMFTARRSRTVGKATNTQGRQFVGASMGALFGKTLSMAEEVHAAMLSRGFNGDMRTLTRLRWRVADSLWTLAVALIAVAAVVMERS